MWVVQEIFLGPFEKGNYGIRQLCSVRHTKEEGMEKEVSFKVSEKTRAVSFYGLGRFPVTLCTNSGSDFWIPPTICGRFWKRANRLAS